MHTCTVRKDCTSLSQVNNTNKEINTVIVHPQIDFINSTSVSDRQYFLECSTDLH
jgi:hypothetical protein